MTKIKTSSTIQENKLAAYQLCPVTYMMEKISGYWKPIILYHLLSGTKRYSEIKKAIPAITEKVLIQHLKQMEADGLIIREARAVVPPYVTYKLSPSGENLHGVLYAMANWALEDSKYNNNIGFKTLKDFPPPLSAKNMK